MDLNGVTALTYEEVAIKHLEEDMAEQQQMTALEEKSSEKKPRSSTFASQRKSMLPVDKEMTAMIDSSVLSPTNHDKESITMESIKEYLANFEENQERKHRTRKNLNKKEIE